jgi:hypothetical protein
MKKFGLKSSESNLEELVKVWVEYQQEVVLLRQIWTERTRPMIQTKLKAIIEKYPIGWFLDENLSKTNMEVITLTFGNKLSGIFDKIQNKTLSKFYGSITFAQEPDGNVTVTLNFPYIDLGQPKDPRDNSNKKLMSVLGEYSPKVFTEELLERSVNEFLEEILESEKSERNVIGF